MENNKKVFLTSLMVLASLVLCMNFVLGATTINVPVQYQNLSGSATFNCTTDLANAMNMSIFYNETNASTVAFLGVLTNLTGLEFASALSTTGLADGLTYNFTCYADNGTDQEFSDGVQDVGIDNTVPTVSITATDLGTSSTEIFPDEGINLSWSCTDSVSGVASTTVTNAITSPAWACALTGTTSWSTATGGEALTSTDLNCIGGYTATISCTDTAGKSTSTTTTYTISERGSGVGVGVVYEPVTTTSEKAENSFINAIRNFFNWIINFFKSLG